MPKINKFRTLLKQLSDNNVHFTRSKDNEWIIYTSGYKTAEAYEINDLVNKMGGFCFKQDFDQICGKTRTFFKKR